MPMALPRMRNLMCNALFTLTLLNQRRGLVETRCVSKRYG